MAAISQSELEQLELTLQQFRVNELHILLSTFRCPKLGKKSELVDRCIALLKNARNQSAILQKIKEISSSRRLLVRPPSPSYEQQRVDGGTLIPNNVTSNMYGTLGVNNSTPFIQQSFSQMDQARKVTMSQLPFYDKLHTIMFLTELPANISGFKAPSRMAFNFFVPLQFISDLCYRNNATPLPRLEIQLRFCLLDPHKEQADDFPPNCSVKIDDVPVTLPNVIPTNKPNVEPKRPSRPVNITPYCQPPRDPSKRPHRITVEWSADRRAWVFGIFVVNRLTSKILLDRLVTNKKVHRNGSITKMTIRNRLSAGSDDDGVRMEKLRLSLLCPLGKTRMAIPAKPSDCTHLQCFDLSLFLQMNEKRPTWKCGICNNPAPYSKIIIDGYFEDILKEVKGDVHEVELLIDGGWRPVLEHYESLSDDDEISTKYAMNGLSPAVSGRMTAAASTPNFQQSRAPSKTENDEIIVLDDSDEEADELNKMKRASNVPAGTTVRPTSNQSVVCIDLDDSDVVEPATAATGPGTSGVLITSNAPSSCSTVPPVSSSQPINPSCIPLPPSQNSRFLPTQPPGPAPVFSVTTNMQNAVSNQLLMRQVQDYGPPIRPPYYSGVYPGPQHNNPNYFQMFDPQMPSYSPAPPELHAHTVAEELRSLMATIQQSSSYSNYS